MGEEKDIKVLNAEKIRYLSQYINLKKSISRLEEQRQELFINNVCPSVNYSGIPSSHVKRDLSDYIVGLSEVESKLIKLKAERFQLQREIVEKIEALEDETERAVLDYRYIRGLQWEEIAVKMNYSYRNITRIHGRALLSFKM